MASAQPLVLKWGIIATGWISQIFVKVRLLAHCVFLQKC